MSLKGKKRLSLNIRGIPQNLTRIENDCATVEGQNQEKNPRGSVRGSLPEARMES